MAPHYKSRSISKQLGGSHEIDCTGRCNVPCMITYEFVRAVCLHFCLEAGGIEPSDVQFGLAEGKYVECIFNIFSFEKEKRKAIWEFFLSSDYMCYYYEDIKTVILRSAEFKTTDYSAVCDMSGKKV